MNRLDAQREALLLLRQHGLTALGWTFAWDNAKRRCGSCQYGKKRITLSRHYVAHNADKPEMVRDTILHEIAHALVGGGHGHGPVWRAKCREIGALPQTCKLEGSITVTPGKYVAKCGGCSREFRRFRKPKAYRPVWCAICGPKTGLLNYKLAAETVAERDSVPREGRPDVTDTNGI